MTQSEASRRKSTRTIIKSARARKCDEPIPGIDSLIASMDAEPASNLPPAKYLRSPDPLSRPANIITSTKTSRNVHTKPSSIRDTAKGVKTRLARRDAQCRTVSDMPPPQTTSLMPPPALKRSPTPAQDDLLSRINLNIYNWPDPKPTALEHLSDRQIAWKEQQDHRDAFLDNNEDLDDWFVKCGNQAAYSNTIPSLSLQHSIATSFIRRAKRAYRLGMTWEAFEDEELAIDSMSQVREIRDLRLRAIHEKEAVDNNLRLRIFYSIRQRLCLEIWLQPFPQHRRPMGIEPNGRVIAPIPASAAGRTSGGPNRVHDKIPVARNDFKERDDDHQAAHNKAASGMPTGSLIFKMEFREG